MLAHHDTAVLLSPAKVIAPIGSEVVLLCGVCGKRGHLLADERVEWTLESRGVGQFVEVGKVGSLDWLRLPQQRPQKISPRFAIGRTSARYVLLTRGTPTANDDIPVLRGQAWITVTSPVEGVSYVTAYAPDVYGWDRRIRTSRIYWLDAQWAFPPPAINPVGTRHTFTTSVIRHSDQTPIAGWRVRYEVVGGPAAGFAPDGAPVIDVVTDAAGQASAELFQTESVPGTNTISIQIVRPAADGLEELVVGSGTVLKTWTAPQLALEKTGPAVGSVGATLSYRIRLSNPGELPATNLIVTDNLPAGVQLASATPQPASTASGLEWRVEQLAPGATYDIALDVVAQRTGSFQNCASVTADGGLTAQDCVTTTVHAASLDVNMTGPEKAEVNQDVTFEITLTNRGQAAATGIVLTSTFDEGFEAAQVADPEDRRLPLRRTLEPLEAGQSRRIGITLRAVKPGPWCNRLEVVADGSIAATAESCVEVAAAARPQLTLRKTGPQERTAGETASFQVEVRNEGNVTLQNLRVADSYDPSLTPIRATPGFVFEGDDLVWYIDSLAPGRTATVQVECRCLTATPRACNRASATAEGTNLAASDQVCFEIRPSTRPVVSVTVSDLRDPIQVGGELVYVARVTNSGPGEIHGVQLVGTAPPGTRPLAAGTRGPTRFDIQGQAIRFQPVDRLAAGATISYEIRLSAQRAGEPTFRVEVDSIDLEQPLVAEETTTIFEPNR